MINIGKLDEDQMNEYLQELLDKKKNCEKKLSGVVNELERTLSGLKASLSQISTEMERLEPILSNNKFVCLKNIVGLQDELKEIASCHESYTTCRKTLTKHDEMMRMKKLEKSFKKYDSDNNLDKCVDVYQEMKTLTLSMKGQPVEEQYLEKLSSHMFSITGTLMPILTDSIHGRDKEATLRVYSIYCGMSDVSDFFFMYSNILKGRISRKFSEVVNERQFCEFLDWVSNLLSDEMDWIGVDTPIDALELKKCISLSVSRLHKEILEMMRKLFTGKCAVPSCRRGDFGQFNSNFKDRFDTFLALSTIFKKVDYFEFHQKHTDRIGKALADLFDGYDEALATYFDVSLQEYTALLEKITLSDFEDRIKSYCCSIRSLVNEVREVMSRLGDVRITFEISTLTNGFMTNSLSCTEAALQVIKSMSRGSPRTDVLTFWNIHKSAFSLYSVYDMFASTVFGLDSFYDNVLNPRRQCVLDTNAVIGAHNKSCSELRVAIDRLKEKLVSLPSELLASYATQIVSTLKEHAHESTGNEVRPEISEICELLVHLPIQFETIIDTYGIEEFIRLFASAFGKVGETTVAAWFQKMIDTHVAETVSVIVTALASSSLQEVALSANTSHVEEVIFSLNCGNKVKSILNGGESI